MSDILQLITTIDTREGALAVSKQVAEHRLAASDDLRYLVRKRTVSSPSKKRAREEES